MESGENINTGVIHSFGAGFAGQSGQEHFARRQKEGFYQDITLSQYEERALHLLQQNVGGDIYGYETKSGKVIRWNKTTGDYAVGISGKRIKTMFPLRGGKSRFDKLREYDEREDDVYD